MTKFEGLKELKKTSREQSAVSQAVADGVHPETMAVASERRGEGTDRAAAGKIGKRNNPGYVQRTAYIKKETDQAVKIKLIQQDVQKEFSELVDELLIKWLAEK